ncbi:MAG: molybdopterin molybdotransferase MoeA [Pseudomonadales bacterium]|jgi:molybdopterin molybdotransferase
MHDCSSEQALISLENALAYYAALPLLEPAAKSLLAASGEVLAEPAYAACDLPAFTQSAMDGYALRYADLGSALTVVGEVAAGDVFPRPLRAGEAVRIFTGGRLPEGTDTIARQEIAQRDGMQLSITEPLKQGQDVRLRGEEASCGTQILAAGQRLTPGRVAALAMAGVARVTTYRRPRVAVIITGKEVGHTIPDANGPLIASWLAAQGLVCTEMRWVGDDLSELAAALAQASAEADWVITTGGASVGDYDYLPAAAQQAGFTCDFHKVAQRPGKPVWFGRKLGCLLLALPGNPGAVWVGLYVHAAAILKRLEGDEPLTWQRGRLVKSMKANPSVALLQRMQQQQDESGAVWLVPLPHQGSHQLSNLAQANALVWFPVCADAVEEGAVLPFLRIG